MLDILKTIKWKNIIKNSKLFDVHYYLTTYPDVRKSDIDPIKHYIKYGAQEGRNPSHKFNTRYYLSRYSDIQKSHLNPLVHYVLYGKNENRSTQNKIKNIKLIKDTPLNKKILFEKQNNPLVSIIIPIYNQYNYTFKCLQSIKKNVRSNNYEIILADDNSQEEDTKNIHNYIKNIKIVRNEKNLGFLLNCNNAAKYALGKYLLFLNNDTQVQVNWLESLLSLIESNTKIGLVGSKLIYPDGRLQEAGGIIWNDASGWNYGRLDKPEKAEYNYLKEVDYISGASIMIEKKLWNNIGGFDKRYTPAYYEDVDLAFEVRKRGFQVVFQPKSTLIHFEGISNGTDLNGGIKRHQLINKEKFLNKWTNILNTEHYKNAKNVFFARDKSKLKKHVLFIDHYLPHYDQDAGSKATFQYLKVLVESNIKVHFIGDNFWDYPGTPYLDALTNIGIEVLYGTWYANNWKKWLNDYGKYFDYVILSRPHISEKYINVIKETTTAKIIYFAVDLHYLREEREYRLKKDNLLLESSKKWKVIEFDIMSKVDAVCVYSHIEVTEIKKIDKSINAMQVPLYMYDNFIKVNYNPDKRKDIIFVGGFSHGPNLDAMLWFVHDILPLILKKIPTLHFYIIGSNPPKEILNMECNNITVTGFISDKELINYYNTSKLAVAPLRFGAGMKGKVVDTLYHGLPLVTTSIGAEGIKNKNHFLKITNESKLFANEVVSLYNNNDILNKMSKESVIYCKNNFSKKKAKIILAKTIKELK